MLDNIPQDADGDEIKRVIEDGVDISRPVVVNFSVALHCISDAESMASIAKGHGFITEVEVDANFDSFTCSCSKAIILCHENVVGIQSELDGLADQFDGWSDGWGTFGDSSS